MRNRLARSSPAFLALGAFAGAAIAGALAPLARGAFGPPSGGVGVLTLAQYPKAFDYFVIVAIVCGALIGGIAASYVRREDEVTALSATRRPRWWPIALTTFVLMCFIHDHPYVPLEPFHDGEHLTPAFLLDSGARPYRDYFVLHGLGVDGGLDALVLGDPPSPFRVRRISTVLDAATLALLAAIAAELCTTMTGVAFAVFASLCALGAGQVPVFPYARLAPLLLAALGLLRYARTGRARALLLAFAASTVGLLWSLDVGSYALAGTTIAFVLIRIAKLEAKPLPAKRVAIVLVAAIALPIAILLALRADLAQFIIDSFIIIPRAIDAVWSLPAPSTLTWESARYYVPSVFYTLLLLFALRSWARGEREAASRLLIIGVLSLIAFRTASGRAGWSHTRFAIPLLGVAIVAFIIEPLLLTKRRLAAIALAIPLIVYLEFVPNITTGAKLVAGWRARQTRAGLVAYPFKTGKGIYTTRQNADELAALNGLLTRVAPNDAPILDLSNERAFYYLLQRRPSLRCFDVAMLSAPPLRDEAMQQLARTPPACVIVEGMPEVDQFDGVPNEQRVPWLFAWVDAHYPRREHVGRFTVAVRQ
ncbi:MAG: hypothetical protein JWO97_4266 [Acidobacteria bacterium]|nr:hypothetical protein [Acidobacteriota bacterium]